MMNGAALIAKDPHLQDQFNIIEDLMLAFCEKVALPCFLCRDANPDLYAYLGYLKTQVEAKPCEEDFETIRVMGKGGFGLVKGCKTQTSLILWSIPACSRRRPGCTLAKPNIKKK